jgi:hypothetical protein
LPDVKPLFVQVLIFAPTVITSVQAFADEQAPTFLKISNPVSLLLLSVQVNIIELEEDPGAAARFIGL